MKTHENIFNKIGSYIILSLPFIWLTATLVSLVEAYYYRGVFIKHTLFHPPYLYSLFIIVGLLKLFFLKTKSGVFIDFFRKLSLLTAFFFGVMIAAFFLLDTLKYPNYVFSTYHIHLKELTTTFFLAIYMYLISSKNIFLINYKNFKSLCKLKYIIGVIILWISVQNIYVLGSISINNLSFMFNNPTASYDEKMREKLGKQFYDYTLFIKENTQEFSKILIPPFPAYPWPQSGNYAYMRYFLYPRKVFNGGEYEPIYDLKKKGIDYVLVAWGETMSTSGGYTHGWPKFDVAAEEVIYMINEKDKKKVIGDYVYEAVKGKELWGVIRITK